MPFICSFLPCLCFDPVIGTLPAASRIGIGRWADQECRDRLRSDDFGVTVRAATPTFSG
jgi:hypothetical protein